VNYLLHEALTTTASHTPEKPALVDGDRELSYSDLDRLTNQIAHLLLDVGVSPGDRVGLYLPKSVEAVAGAYAVMKAGGVYVPLDPDAPVDRIGYIIENADIAVLLTADARATESLALGAKSPSLRTLVFLDRAPDDHESEVTVLASNHIADQPAAAPAVRVIDRDLALILYTSGSTGTPKGVMLSHLNVMTFVRWAVEEFEITAADRLSQFAPLHFDLSTFDIYGAALAGATVYLAPRTVTIFPVEIRNFLERHEISVTYAVPSSLIMLTERTKLEEGHLPHLRTILFAGEVFPTKYLSRLMRLLPHVEFANLFGPTETNVCTFYRVPEPPLEDDPPISIGVAIDNVETLVMKKDGSLAQPGEAGELLVRGPSVMQGYWRDAERTEKTLIPNPFGEMRFDPVYRTGDLVIEEDDGNYTFLGRRDNQIKSRGYRIELGDIESVLYAHHEVIECAAVAVPDEKITNRIMAYVVVDGELTPKELASFVGERLPKYMIPDTTELLRVLPKTSTGKIDRQALLKSAQGGESQ
jgi:amino acid adenylation domain-containing protein